MTAARTQAAALIAHLQQHGTIEPMQALNLLGIYRLAARIHDLRAAGHRIDTDQGRNPPRTAYTLRRDAQSAAQPDAVDRPPAPQPAIVSTHKPPVSDANRPPLILAPPPGVFDFHRG